MPNLVRNLIVAAAILLVGATGVLGQSIHVPGVAPLSAGPLAWLPKHIRDGCVTPATADEAEFLRCRAREALNANSLDAAVVRYKRVLKRVPGDPEATLGLAYTYYFLGDTRRSWEYADDVVCGGSGYLPVAIQLKMNLDVNRGRYGNMVVSAHQLLDWARLANNRILEIDANLLVARVHTQYVLDCDKARAHLAAARALLQPHDREVGYRLVSHERDFRRWSEGRF